MIVENGIATVRCASASARFKKEEKSFNGCITEDLKFYAVKNGCASAQIIISAKEDLTYALKASSLKDGKGNEISATCFEIFYEKYIYVDKNWQKNGYPLGNYPDALIPIEAPIKHNDNFIKSGENGALWIDLKVPENTQKGRYSGKFTINIGCEIEINVIAEIADLSVGKTTSKSLFNNNTNLIKHYEVEFTQKMYDTYSKCLIEHRISPTNIGGGEPQDGDKYGKWLDKCVEMINFGASTIGIPTVEASDETGTIFDSGDLLDVFIAIYVRSYELKLNIFSYCAFYDWLIDEPFCCGYAGGKVQKHVELYQSTTEKAIVEINKYESANSEFGKELKESLKKVPQIVTDYYTRPITSISKPLLDREGNPYIYDVKKVALCPKFDGYDTAEMREEYIGSPEVWWYGCNTPNAPFVGYHIDDAGYSAQIVSWLMARYKVVGNLYWATNFEMECNTTGKFLFLDDAFGTAHSGTGANGEGALIYPGKTYGIYGPIGSVRLKAIRNGNEDYELLLEMFKAYETLGADGYKIFDRLTAPFLDGTKIDGENYDFDDVRNKLVKILEIAKTKKATIETDDCGEKIKFTLKGVKSAKFDGKAANKEGNAYVCEIEKKDGNVVVSMDFGDASEELEIYVGCGLKIILHESLFARNAVYGDAKEITRNEDDIRREINVKLNGGKAALTVETGEKIGNYGKCGLLIRATKETPYELRYAGQKAADGELKFGWNRINFEPNGDFDKFEVVLTDGEEVGIGEVILSDK